MTATASGPAAAEWALVGHAVETPAVAVPAAVLERARDRVIDIVGCVVAGRRGDGCAELAGVLRADGGSGPAVAPDAGPALPLGDAALLAAVQARSFDHGMLTPVPRSGEVWSHLSESTVPAALAVAAHVGATLGEVLAALALTDDAAARVSRAAAFVPGRHWDSPGLVNRVGTTLAAARLLGLATPAAVHAVGLAVQQMGSTFQPIDQGALAFKLGQGLAARDGVLSARLAAAGWTGGAAPLTGRVGFGEVFADGLDADLLVADLGAEYLGDDLVKPYPGCRFTHAAIDCALELAGPAPDAIRAITIRVAPMHAVPLLDRDPRAACTTQVGALFSLQYQVANALVRGTPTPEHFLAEALADADVAALIGRTRVEGSLPAAALRSAEVAVELADGSRRTATAPSAWGDPRYRPVPTEQLDAKAAANLAFGAALGPDAAAALVRELRTASLQTPAADLLARCYGLTPRRG